MVIFGPLKQKATFGVKAVGCVTLFDWLVVRQQSCVSGILCSVWSYHPPPGWSSVEEIKDTVMHIFLSRNQDPVWRLYQPLIVSPVFLYPLPSLITNYLNPPFGTQGMSRRLNEAYILQTRNGEQRTDLYSRVSHGVLLSFNLGNRATMTVITSCKNGS